MAPPDQGGGASPPTAAALRRQMSSTCSSRDETVQLERRLSCSSASFSSPAASPSSSSSASSTYHQAASSSKSSCESIPFADPELQLLGKQSSTSSSTSSYESSFHYVDPDHDDCSKYLDFEPPLATRAPAVQAMTAAATECCVAYDPKRLPSAMFRTRSTNPAEWSVTSNESLFSIRLSNSSDSGDLYYDAAGFPRCPSMGSDMSSMTRTPFVLESTAGGLCLREDCARCSGTGAARKSVRFATTESVSGSSKHSAVYPAHANVQAPAACTAKTPEKGATRCQFECCWPPLPTMWWPRCCAWHCHCCDCRC